MLPPPLPLAPAWPCSSSPLCSRLGLQQNIRQPRKLRYSGDKKFLSGGKTRAMNRRIPLRRGAPTGFLLILLGLWGGLVPFVGPYFDYALGANRTWHWTTNRLWLEVLPAAVVVLGGLLMFVSRTRGRASL